MAKSYLSPSAIVKPILALSVAILAYILPTEFPKDVIHDPAHPYKWADLADSLFEQDNIPAARQAYARAVERAPATPQILVRAANFHVHLDEPEAVLRYASRVVRMVPDFDGILFHYLDGLFPNPSDVLAGFGDDRRATRSYTEHLIASNLDAAGTAWQWCVTHRFADDQLANTYTNALLTAKRYDLASHAWSHYLGTRAKGYPGVNVVFNGSFETPPTGSSLDWRISPSPQFETTIDQTVAHHGKSSLRIRFKGEDNVSYANVIQLVPIKPGSHQFEAWIKTDSLTTNQGPQLAVTDPEHPGRLDFHIGPFLGTANWTHITESLTIPPQTRVLAIKVIREPSMKFDSKIAGTFWLDAVQIRTAATLD